MTDGFEMKQIGACTLYRADCMDVLPKLDKVDAVITDPPYGLGDWNNRGTNGARPFDSDFTQAWDIALDDNSLELIQGAGKHVIMWGGNYYADRLPRSKQWLVWNKWVRGMHFNDCEMAWCSGWREANRMFDFSPSAAEPKQHQTQKPVALMRWCISHLPDSAGTILDPFMGSGTTGVACVTMGRRFIGIERERKYFDIACKRISEARRQSDLFVALPAEQVAMDL